MDGNTSSLFYSPSPFQKPSTTDLVLNKVCGGGKWGREPTLQKGAFLELFYGPTNATYVERHDRPNAAIQRPSKCRAAAFGLWPFVHRAAFNVAECLQCGRGEQAHPIE
jgi:hypothetical protein